MSKPTPKNPNCDYERTDFPCVYFHLFMSFEPSWPMNICECRSP